jgi:hypothetical protein
LVTSKSPHLWVCQKTKPAYNLAMKRFGQSLVGAATALLVCTGSHAQDVATADKPYSAILSRNMFALVPIPVNPPPAIPVPPPPKITPNGIMTLFGKLQVLFKVATPAEGGKPAQDDSYTMSEGERQDDIEVTKIDEAGGIITFDNHGVVQELALVAGQATGSGGVPQPGPGAFGPGRIPIPNGLGNNDPRLRARRNIPGAFPSANQNSNPDGTSDVPALPIVSGSGGAAEAAPSTAAAPEPISPEAQVIMMEAQRAKWQDEGNPATAIMPPTPLTPEPQPNENAPGGQLPANGR